MAAKPSAETLREMRLKRFGASSSSSSAAAASLSSNIVGSSSRSASSDPLNPKEYIPSSEQERELKRFREQWTVEVRKKNTAQQKAMEAQSVEAQEKRAMREAWRLELEELDRRPTMQELDEIALREKEEKDILRLRIKKMDDDKREYYRTTWLPELDQQIAKWMSGSLSSKPDRVRACRDMTHAATSTNSTGSYVAAHKVFGITELHQQILPYISPVDILAAMRVNRYWRSVASHLQAEKNSIQSWIDQMEPVDLYGVDDRVLSPCCTYWSGPCKTCERDPDNVGRHLIRISQLKANPFLQKQILGNGGLIVRAPDTTEFEVKLARDLKPRYIYPLEERFANPDASWRNMYLTKPPCRKVALYHAYASVRETRTQFDIIYDPQGIRCGHFLDTLEDHAATIAQLWMNSKLEERAREETFIDKGEFQNLKECKQFLQQEPRIIGTLIS
ncbi:hypothetical protein BU16DRAFT_523564 [Lophium mytilinum]|uniref:F-box domain-containing protein n=1 Tax=Lophium mytilinum TaxID=390894 RepID=A0A6A6RAR7_9PEZI|nr:hypothetical protein BU16DRAFT_523564 [Lophium mytilinum]